MSKTYKNMQDFLKNSPKSVQELHSKYPAGKYRIKEGAPYGVSTAGTIVDLYSYTESGNVGVIVRAREKKPDALIHERMLQEEHGGKDPMHDKDILVHIDPVWMEPVSKPCTCTTVGSDCKACSNQYSCNKA